MDIANLYEIYKSASGVSTDTRNIHTNSIYFALKGEHFNGNRFAEEALQKGASFAVIDDASFASSDHMIVVDNVLETLQELANFHRNQLDIPVIGLTGSNGKTTTKELIYAVLSQKYNVCATQGNLNNHIGVPLTLLSINSSHEMAVIEMGANHQKEIAFLSSICEPDYGYITNFGKAHLEGFGGVDGVIKGKSELYTYLKENNKTAFVNPEDPIQVEKTQDINSIALDLANISLTGSQPHLQIDYKGTSIQTQLIGAYNFSNIAVAMTIGGYFGVSDEAIHTAISSYVSENNRSQVIKKDDYEITLDAYNANPSSMKVALESFAAKNVAVKTVILGDMFELGEDAAKEHQGIVDLVESLTIDHAYFIGSHFFETRTCYRLFETFEDFEGFVKLQALPKGSVLIKGSRGMKLERVLDLL